MRIDTEKIIATRIKKGLTQEELAQQAKVNLRTIQRVEKSETKPREITLNLICDALELEVDDVTVKQESAKRNRFISKAIDIIFLILLNMVLMMIFGYLTIDINAQTNSVIGGLLLSIFLPFFIVFLTQKMGPLERLLKFGSGFIVYFFLFLFAHGFPQGFVSGLYPCLLICVTVLYFGDNLTKHLAPTRENE